MALRSVISCRPLPTVVPFHSCQRPQGRVSARFVAKAAAMDRFNELLDNNKSWASEKVQQQADFFSRYAEGQWPEFLWIGCSDSRVVGNDILGTDPGDVFAHRNVGNVVSLGDLNCMSVLDYGIGALKVKHVIVSGHYGCGAVKASLALPLETPGVVNSWIYSIRQVRNKYAAILNALPEDARPDVLSELNALEQTVHACSTSAVQTAWKNGEDLTVHCVVYDIKTGHLKVLMKGIKSVPSMLDLELLDGHVKKNGVKTAFNASLKERIALEA